MECELPPFSTNFYMRFRPATRESNIDDVLQISNIFVNVSKGEVAKANDLEKAFRTSNINEIVKEVGRFTDNIVLLWECMTFLKKLSDTQERRSASWREGARARYCITEEGACDAGGREMRRSFHTTAISSRYDRKSYGGSWVQRQDEQNGQESGRKDVKVQ